MRDGMMRSIRQGLRKTCRLMSILSLLSIANYRSAIALDQPWTAPPPAKGHEVAGLVQGLIQQLTAEGLALPERLGAYPGLQRLRMLLTVRTPGKLPPATDHKLNAVLQYLRTLHLETEVARLPVLDRWPQLSVWRGDITTLRADAIVNAANAQMVGCFQPLHACIDNAIHWQAGPQLRRDCEIIMQLQGQLEATGTAKLTRGYNLPARYVLHTVGPIVRSGQPSHHNQAQLAGAYTSCLDLAAQQSSIATLAFCCISTGVFGYPKRAAADLAIRTVTHWLQLHPDRFQRIVFNVFDAEDEVIYRHALQDYLGH